MKLLLPSSLLVTLLCAPALADSTTTYLVELATKTERHALLVADRACGELQIKSSQRESFLKVCAYTHDKSKQVRLEVDRRIRDKADESRQTAVVNATVGASYDLLDGKMTVKTQ